MNGKLPGWEISKAKCHMLPRGTSAIFQRKSFICEINFFDHVIFYYICIGSHTPFQFGPLEPVWAQESKLGVQTSCRAGVEEHNKS